MMGTVLFIFFFEGGISMFASYPGHFAYQKNTGICILFFFFSLKRGCKG